MTLIYGSDADLCKWASLQLFRNPDSFDDRCVAIGIMRDTQIIAVVVYNNYTTKADGSPLTIEMSIASIDKKWATRHNLRAFFSYPFTKLGLGRVQTLCSANDEGVKMFNQRLGFTQEGYHRLAWPMGGDAISWSMLKSECGWL